MNRSFLRFSAGRLVPLTVGMFLTLASVSSRVQATTPIRALDYQADYGARSYPLGSILSAQAGYGLQLWRAENPEPENKKFYRYGYIRPAITIDSAAVVNRLAAEVEIYPIAIWSLAAGTGIGARYKNDYTDFECGQLICDGSLSYQYLRSRLILGYGPLALVVTGRYDFMQSHNDTKAFYDEMTYLIGQAGTDHLRTLNVLSAYIINPKWSLGVLGTFQNYMRSRANNNSVLGLVNFSWRNDYGSWRASVGAGPFNSSVQRSDTSAVLSLHWNGAQGLALF